MKKNVPRMSEVWEMRRFILAGYSTAQVADLTGYSASVVRSYTKAERQKLKERSGPAYV